MYCKNCGKEVGEGASFCTGCGFATKDGNKYCAHCGEKVNDGASVCLKCGYKLGKAGGKSEKSMLVAGLLGLFVGGFGIHNFYLGRTGKAVAQLLLCWTFISSIWALVDAIYIFLGKYKDGEGKTITE